MTDIKDYLRLLLKRKHIIIAIPIIAALITFFLVRHLPDAYDSKARIATGIVDDSQTSLAAIIKQESEINQKFSNLTQMMLLKKMIDQVSYKLMMHDLAGNKPFRKSSRLLKQLSPPAKKHAAEVYQKKYEKHEELSLYIGDQNGLNEVLKSMDYDEMKLREKLSVYRVNNSDYIDVQYESENPDLSAFVANTLCHEFITYYDSLRKSNQNIAVNFLEKLVGEKYIAMNNKMQELKNYKIQNRILYLNEEAKSVFGQIADFETRRETAEKEVVSYTAAIKNIDDKFKPQDRQYLEATLTNINSDILNDKENLKQLTGLYVTSNFDEKYKRSIDSVRSDLAGKVNQSTDKYIFNPMSAKQSLVSEKLGMEVARDISKNSIASLSNEIARLHQRFNSLVPHEAVIQSYENAIDVASREYFEILQKYNQTSLQSSFTVAPLQIEIAMPGTALPSKKAAFVILAGIVSFVFCLVIFFVLFYIDNSVNNAKTLAQKTRLPVLGSLTTLSGDTLHLKEMWQGETEDKALLQFKNSLRSSRFEIEKEMAGAKMLAVASMKKNEGKTFFAMSLAFACAKANNRVLLIDGNFGNNAISGAAKPHVWLEDFLKDHSGSCLIAHNADGVTVMGNRGNDTSLLEIAGRQEISDKLQCLRNQFDFIIAETPALENRNKAKEWMMFADKCVAVFEAGQTIGETKKQYANYLLNLNEQFAGWIVNKTIAGV